MAGKARYKYTTSVGTQKRAVKSESIIENDMQQERGESAREWRIVFYKAINGECVVFYKAVSEKYCFKKQLCYANNIGDAQVRF